MEANKNRRKQNRPINNIFNILGKTIEDITSRKQGQCTMKKYRPTKNIWKLQNMKAEIEHCNGRIQKSSQDYLPANGTKCQKDRKQNRKSLVTWAQSINSEDQESQ